MHIIRTISEMLSTRRALAGQTIGFVPTMGYLHEGHLSLVDRARNENDCVVVSIFVNPTQFGPSEDLAKYPRDIRRDLMLLNDRKVDYVFLPEAQDMYPGGKMETTVQVSMVTEMLEGELRPGHFAGVATIVAKLFHLVKPTHAYFGRKDAQQLTVINKMVQDLNFETTVVPCPTLREPDGLAMSSRNVYLSASERQTALFISRGLHAAHALWQRSISDRDTLLQTVRQEMAQGDFAAIDYIELVDSATFATETQARVGSLIVVAAKVGPTRLIDNIWLD